MNQQLLTNKNPVCSFMFLEPDEATLGIAKPMKINTLLTSLMQFTSALYTVVSGVVAKFQTSARVISHSRLPRRVCIGIEICHYSSNIDSNFFCSLSCRICNSDNFSANMRHSFRNSVDLSCPSGFVFSLIMLNKD